MPKKKAKVRKQPQAKVMNQTPSQKIQADLKKYLKYRKAQLGFFKDAIAKCGYDPNKIRATDFEISWLKKFGQLPEMSTKVMGYGFVGSRKPKPGEKMAIHTHSRGSSKPSTIDLKTLVKREKRTKRSSSLIVVTQKGKHVGYTFLTVRNLKKAKTILKLDDQKRLRF